MLLPEVYYYYYYFYFPAYSYPDRVRIFYYYGHIDCDYPGVDRNITFLAREPLVVHLAPRTPPPPPPTVYGKNLITRFWISDRMRKRSGSGFIWCFISFTVYTAIIGSRCPSARRNGIRFFFFSILRFTIEIFDARRT